MLDVNLFDTTFPDQACSVALQTPQTMRYVRDRTHFDGITVFVDGEIYNPVVTDVESRYKVAWLHEARALHPENYERIWDVVSRFDFVMTHDAELLHKGAHYMRPGNPRWPFVKTIRGGSWVALDAWGLPPKTKDVAMIRSAKATLPGHQLRHAIADAGLGIDLYGPLDTPIGHDKALAYRDYRYAVVVEACQEANFFSEHLIDAIAYGCVPLYWGCPNIGAYLAPGMLWFRDVTGLMGILGALRASHYTAFLPSLRSWQAKAREYAITEDWQVAHIYQPLLEGVALW